MRKSAIDAGLKKVNDYNYEDKDGIVYFIQRSKENSYEIHANAIVLQQYFSSAEDAQIKMEEALNTFAGEIPVVPESKFISFTPGEMSIIKHMAQGYSLKKMARLAGKDVSGLHVAIGRMRARAGTSNNEEMLRLWIIERGMKINV